MRISLSSLPLNARTCTMRSVCTKVTAWVLPSKELPSPPAAAHSIGKEGRAQSSYPDNEQETGTVSSTSSTHSRNGSIGGKRINKRGFLSRAFRRKSFGSLATEEHFAVDGNMEKVKRPQPISALIDLPSAAGTVVGPHRSSEGTTLSKPSVGAARTAGVTAAASASRWVDIKQQRAENSAEAMSEESSADFLPSQPARQDKSFRSAKGIPKLKHWW